EESCWICLEGTEKGPLERPCPCPRLVHRDCLGRWRLQSAGRRQENLCRFCGYSLPGLEESLTPAHLRATRVVTYMAIIHKNQALPVRPGAEGMAEFRARVRCLFGIPPDKQFNVSFECMAPSTGEVLVMNGMACFDAAVTCAAISAKKRAVGEGCG
ncbi:zygote-specific protein, partial [Volvox carteri f. nagariensis]